MQCARCQLVFVPKQQRLDPIKEKEHYDHHINNPDDPGYRHFLSRLTIPLLERIELGSHGLDFGCGPGPALAQLLQEVGHKVDLHDIYYYPNAEYLSKQYDFVTATEVIEHLYDPHQIWKLWLQMVKQGGWLGIMTKLVVDLEGFKNWHYKFDPTHVCFYSQATFRYLAQRDKLELEFIGSDVILLRKLA